MKWFSYIFASWVDPLVELTKFLLSIDPNILWIIYTDFNCKYLWYKLMYIIYTYIILNWFHNDTEIVYIQTKLIYQNTATGFLAIGWNLVDSKPERQSLEASGLVD